MSQPTTASTNNVPGILLMLLAVSMFSMMDASLKALAAHYPPFQVGALRALASLPLIVAWISLTSGWRSMLKIRWRLHLLRGALGIVMMASFVFALKSLPLSTAYTFFFAAPLLIVALSGPLLGEQVGLTRWLAIVIGFCGVMVALRPTGEGLALWSGLAVLLTATCYALSALCVRILARTDSTQSMVFWLLFCMALGSLIIALPNWHPIQAKHYWLIVLVGLFGGVGQYALTEAFCRAEASALATLEYSGLAWTLLFDVVIWHALPSTMTWLGAAIIVGSGLYLLQAEQRLARGLKAQVAP